MKKKHKKKRKKHKRRRHGCLFSLFCFVALFMAFDFFALIVGIFVEPDGDGIKPDSSSSYSVENAGYTDSEVEDNGAAENANASLDVSSPILVQYHREGFSYPLYSYYFTYTNTSEKTLCVSGFNVRVFDGGEGLVDRSPFLSSAFAPAILNPGETGYAAADNLNADGSFPESFRIDVKGEFTALDSGSPSLSCSNPEVASIENSPSGMDYFSSTLNDGATVSLSLTNPTQSQIVMASLAVGLLNIDGGLIGVAFANPDSLMPNEARSVLCTDVILLDGYSLGDVAQMDPKAATERETRLRY